MRKYWRLLLILVVLSGIGLSCRNRGDKPQIADVTAEELQVASIPAMIFTDEEIHRIDALREAGGLRAAVLLSSDNYLPQEDGSIVGFDYHLAEYFCRQLDLPLVLDPQEDFSLFFSDGGRFDEAVIKNDDIIYTPDLLKTNDIYILPLSINEWRERLTSMIPMYPTGVGIYGRGAENITSFRQMDNMIAAVLKDSYAEHLVEFLEDEYDIHLRRFYVPADENAGIYLIEKQADVTFEGIIPSSKNIAAHPELSISPLLIRKVTVGWAVKSEDESLSSVISKLVENSLIDGSFQRIFFENFNVDFDIMLNLLGE